MKSNFPNFMIAVLIIFISSCKKDNNGLTEDADVNLGGETTTNVSFINTFQIPAPNLSATELDLHRAGDKAFADIFVTAPNIVNQGLGPIFNQNSCENCHVANGRSPFPSSTSDLRGLLFRLSVPGINIHNGPVAVPGFGGQLQNKATFGIQAEASITWQEIEDIQQYLDGEKYSLRHFVFAIENPYIALPSNVMVSPRIAPPIIGLGLLEAISEQDILSYADPNDTNGDGISGKANYVWNSKEQKMMLGRFGWKANEPSLLQQTADAYNNDMGITSPYNPIENFFDQSQYDKLADDPEIDQATLLAATFYTQSLAVPRRRNWEDSEVRNGKFLFSKLKCDACHRPGYTTAQHPEYPFLSNQSIFPYTDMLLHDMGDGLADNRPDYEATGNEWRTPPLWGIGLTKIVGGHTNFLHDGRARSLEEAILWHGGESENSKEAFRKLNKTDRAAVVRFLESL